MRLLGQPRAVLEVSAVLGVKGRVGVQPHLRANVGAAGAELA